MLLLRARGCLTLACAAMLTVRPAAAIPAAIDPLAADAPADAVHAPQMAELTIPSHGTTMYGVFYRAAGAGPHPTVVLLHGFAGFEQNEDLAQAVRRAGFNALIFHYRGAWGSGGAFSFAHCVADAQAVLAYLRNATQALRLGVDPERLLLVGHSVGAHVAGIVGARDSAVAGVALISAANRRLAMSRPGWAEQTRARFQEELGPLRGASASGLVRELEVHQRDWDLVRLAPRWRGRPVLIVSSDDRFYDEDVAVLDAVRATDPTHLTAVHLSTDHAYSGQRVALTRALLEWLTQFTPQQ